MVLNCEEVKEKWPSYTNGTCSKEDEQMIENHLDACKTCQDLLDKDLEMQEASISFAGVNPEKQGSDPISTLSEKKQRQLIKKAKWKNRLLNAISALGLFIIISAVSGLLTALYYNPFSDHGRGQIAVNVVQTATQMTMPNVFFSGVGSNTNFFFSMDFDSTLKKQIGHEQKAIGQLEGRLLFNQLNVNRNWNEGLYNVKLYFMHPDFVAEQPETEQSFYNETLSETWDTLEVLPEGTVSELALSFDDVYDLNEVYRILSGYELNIAWYAIDTGTEKNGDHYGSPYLSAGGIWGVAESAIFDFERGSSFSVASDDGDHRAEVFKTGLRYLSENEKTADKYWQMRHMGDDVSLKDRVDFVEEYGANSYGVVVTGPTKELLKLKENEQIIFATLGEVELWNWYHTPAGGTIYN
ncbi:anti-sigma factor [Alkalihalophilus pseudofirmus]|uniref:Anti-sigma factor n=1 Tax=Alkalihalophilus pseudofirmus TaxID=79885 RepID=A0AAJ2NLC1_ALKPS|nr:anti-sigma factor [Alkalihalophilus pseudofirmus]MDV2883638.1 anti-sigma factor [Alkalihalophilus pseudofirmus]